jgi:competence protein ComER
MEPALNVGIIGTGAMGAMLVRAHARFAREDRFLVHAANRSPASLAALRSSVPQLQTATPAEVAARADLLFLCLPPEPYLGVAAKLATRLAPTAVFVCISNGVALDDLAAVVPQPIVKVVPSLAHEAGRGVALLIRGPRATPDDVARVRSFMAPFSTVIEIGAEDARIATNITGCGPALVACFAQLLAQSASAFASDLTTEQLDAMSTETVIGAGALLDAGWSLPRLIADVATPGGSTEAALAVLRRDLPGVLDAMHIATSARLAQRRRPGCA